MIAPDVAQAVANIFHTDKKKGGNESTVLSIGCVHQKRQCSEKKKEVRFYCYRSVQNVVNVLEAGGERQPESGNECVLRVCRSPGLQRSCEEGCVEPEAATGGDCNDDTLPAGNGDTQQYVRIKTSV